MLTDFFEVAFLLVGMLLASETVEFIQFDVLSRDGCNDFLIGGFGLRTGAINPTPDGSRMNAFDAGDSLRAKPFEPLLNGALDLLFRRLKVVEGSAIAVTESPPALPTVDNKDHLSIPQGIAAVIG
jgi:hypothetical protein